jgi:LmbE family N-acetylglucosaminyl deacetylase
VTGGTQMTGQPPGQPPSRGATSGDAVARPEHLLPDWQATLIVAAHPDDEAFGLGAIVDRLTAGGTAVHLLCFTHGEASTLNETDSDLHQARARELRQASTELGVVTVTLLNYPDGRLSTTPPGELAAHVTRLAARHRPDGLLVFDDTGITGHPDHQAATRAAVYAADAAGLPVLAWALPDSIASRLRDETGGTFAGQPPDQIDLRIRVNRARQRRAALIHASQMPPAAVLWRRLQLQGDCEHLRWLLPPDASADRPAESALAMTSPRSRRAGSRRSGLGSETWRDGRAQVKHGLPAEAPARSVTRRRMTPHRATC